MATVRAGCGLNHTPVEPPNHGRFTTGGYSLFTDTRDHSSG